VAQEALTHEERERRAGRKLPTAEETKAKWAKYWELDRRINDSGNRKRTMRLHSIWPKPETLLDKWIGECELFITLKAQEVRDHPTWYPRRDWVIEADGFPRRRWDSEKDFDQLREEAEERRKMLDDHYEYERRYGRKDAGERPKEEE
jgi:hypothetical protein